MTTTVFDKSTTAAKKKKQHRHRRHVDEYSAVMKAEKPRSSHLHSYCPKPLKVNFDSQLVDEEILLLLRQALASQWKKFLMVFLGFISPFIIAASPVLDFFPSNFKVAFYVFWFLMLIGFIFESFLSWFFNVYIITDERIIDVDFVSMLYKNISSAKIDRIEDITQTSGGFLASVLDYGHVKIQTAAEQNEFEFDNVPKPAKVTEFLNELIVEEEREKNEGRVN